MKEKHYKEIASLEKQFKEQTHEMSEQLAALLADKESSHASTEDECNELRGTITMLNLKVTDFEEKLRDEVRAHKSAEVMLAERNTLVKEMETQCKRLTAERDSRDTQKVSTSSSRRDSLGVYDDLLDDQDSVDSESAEKLSQLSSENNELKVKLRQLERKLRVSHERYEDAVANIREKDTHTEGKEKDRDSGIVITQEVKNLMDSYKDDDEIEINIDNYNYTNLIENLSSGITSSGDIDKFQKLSANLAYQLKELGRKMIISEERSLELTVELEHRQSSEEEYASNYNVLLNRIEDLNQQILDSQEVLQSKADELELERKNVLNLVEVTSAYIKELEGSLAESKTKIQVLQDSVEQDKSGPSRQPPDGSTGEESKDQADGLTASKPSPQVDVATEQVEGMKQLQGILTAKVMALESDLSEAEEKHTKEISELQRQLKETKKVTTCAECIISHFSVIAMILSKELCLYICFEAFCQVFFNMILLVEHYHLAHLTHLVNRVERRVNRKEKRNLILFFSES